MKLKLLMGENFKCAELEDERTTRKLTNKKSSVPKSKKVPVGSFPKCTRENSTNVKLSKNPENVQSSMTPTENTKWAEMPPKYKSTNVSTNVKC